MHRPLVRAPVPGYEKERNPFRAPVPGYEEERNPFLHALKMRRRRQDPSGGFPDPPVMPPAPKPPDYGDRPQYEPPVQPGLWKSLLAIGLGSAAEAGRPGGAQQVAHNVFEAPRQRALQQHQRALGKHYDKMGVIQRAYEDEWRRRNSKKDERLAQYDSEIDLALFSSRREDARLKRQATSDRWNEEMKLQESQTENQKSYWQAMSDQQEKRLELEELRTNALLLEMKAKTEAGKSLSPSQRADMARDYTRAQGEIRDRYAKWMSLSSDEEGLELKRQMDKELQELKELFESSGLRFPPPAPGSEGFNLVSSHDPAPGYPNGSDNPRDVIPEDRLLEMSNTGRVPVAPYPDLRDSNLPPGLGGSNLRPSHVVSKTSKPRFRNRSVGVNPRQSASASGLGGSNLRPSHAPDPGLGGKKLTTKEAEKFFKLANSNPKEARRLARAAGYWWE